MNFFIKLFKALNSAQKPWQITLAVVLGMLMGLTPLSGIQTFFILFIAFIVNIHLGFFFIMAAQFAAVGYLFDGLFDDFGFYLLSLDSLKEMWTSMYNSGLIRLTYFNNTVVLGSTVIALLLSLPLYLIISKTLHIYRDKIAIYCANHSWLNKFGFFDAPKKAEKAFRIWGLGLFLIIGVLLLLIVFIFLDGLVKVGLEKIIGLPLDKQVHIEKVELSLQEGSLDIHGLSIASKDLNKAAFVAKNIHTNLDFNALLLSKTHIEKIALTGLTFNQDSPYFLKDQEAVSANKPQEQASSNKKEVTKKEKKEESLVQLPSVDDVLKNSQLTSKSSYEDAEKKINSISKKWKDIEKDLENDKALKKIETTFNTLQKKVKKISLKNLKSFSEETKAFTSDINTQKNRYKKLESDFKKDQKEVNALIAKVKKSNINDKKRITSQYTMNAQGGVNVLGSFLGPKVQSYLQTGLDYYEKLAPYLESEPEEKVADRHKGRNVRFNEYTPQADLLISTVDIDGSFQGQNFKATIKDISNNQKLLNKAISFSAKSSGVMMQGFSLKGFDDRRSKMVKDHIDFSVKSVPKVMLDLSAVKLHHSNMGVKGYIDILNEKQLKGNSKLTFSKAKLSASKIKGSLGRSLNKDLSKVKQFTADIKVSGELTQVNISVRSQLTDIMKKSMNSFVKKELQAFQRNIAEKLDSMTKEKLQSLGLKNKDLSKFTTMLKKQTSKLSNYKQKSSNLKPNPKKDLKQDLMKKFKF